VVFLIDHWFTVQAAAQQAAERVLGGLLETEQQLKAVQREHEEVGSA